MWLQWPSACPGAWAPVWLESVGCRDCKRTTANTDPDFFCVHLVYAGRIKFQTGNGVDVIVKPGELFSLWPRVAHHFSAEFPEHGADVRMDWIRLRGALVYEFLDMMGLREDRPVAEAAGVEEASMIFRELQRLAAEYPAGAEQRAVGLLYQLAGACRPLQHPAEPRPSIAYKVRDAMAQQFDSGMGVEGYAQAFHVSRSTLFLKFKEAFGKSPVQVLTNFRIQHAKLLLQTSDLPVAEVGYASGYADPKYFSRIFHQQTGCAPGTFRKDNKQQGPPL